MCQVQEHIVQETICQLMATMLNQRTNLSGKEDFFGVEDQVLYKKCPNAQKVNII